MNHQNMDKYAEPPGYDYEVKLKKLLLMLDFKSFLITASLISCLKLSLYLMIIHTSLRKCPKSDPVSCLHTSFHLVFPF